MKKLACLMWICILVFGCSSKSTDPDVDTQAPFIGWTRPTVPVPANDIIVTTDTMTIEFNVGDNKGVVSAVAVYLGGAMVQSLTTLPFITVLDLSVISHNRAADIYATATDPAGNVGSTSDTLTLVRNVAPDSAAWTLLAIPTPPAARDGHSMSLDGANRRALMFGGLSTATFANVNDLWAFDLDVNAWDSLTPTGTLPISRARHAAEVVGDTLIVFGGFAEGMGMPDSVLQDYGLLDLTTMVWASPLYQLGLIQAMGMATSASSGAAYFYGGVAAEAAAAKDELWTYSSGSGWQQITPAINLPGNRVYSSSSYDVEGNRLFLFGGSGVDESAPTDSSNFRLNMTTGVWRSTLAPGPPPTQKGAVVYDSLNNRMLMWGGANGLGTASTDVWEFSLGALRWQRVPIKNSPPSGRQGHGMVIDEANSRFIVFGGRIVGGIATNETWELRW